MSKIVNLSSVSEKISFQKLLMNMRKKKAEAEM